MHDKFVKKYLDNNALDFVFEQIKSTRSVSEILFNFLKKHHSNIWSLLPEELTQKTQLNFELGGLFKENPIDDYLSIVENYLSEDGNNAWVLIDNERESNVTPENNSIENITKVFYYKETVFHLLPIVKVNKMNLLKTFKFGGWYPFIGVITKLNNSLRNSIEINHLNEKDVNNLINCISTLIIGAFDEEAYLVVNVIS